ncbi:hypothetical protein HJA60_004300 [Vibrio vulnificus]|nr:hypothetical protein [Vibrio vulnificus]
MGDVEFMPAISIYDGENYTQPSSATHKPCPDMAGLENYDPEKTERARFLISKLREKHGIRKRVKPKPNALTYTCTSQGCIEPWGTVSNAKP